jgi:hypothetical protein
MDVPDLPLNIPEPPPLPLSDKHNANKNDIPFLVCQYNIKGVQDLPQELRTHVTMFYEELIILMEGASESWQLITKEKIYNNTDCNDPFAYRRAYQVAEVNLPTNI